MKCKKLLLGILSIVFLFGFSFNPAFAITIDLSNPTDCASVGTVSGGGVCTVTTNQSPWNKTWKIPDQITLKIIDAEVTMQNISILEIHNGGTVIVENIDPNKTVHLKIVEGSTIENKGMLDIKQDSNVSIGEKAGIINHNKIINTGNIHQVQSNGFIINEQSAEIHNNGGITIGGTVTNDGMFYNKGEVTNVGGIIHNNFKIINDGNIANKRIIINNIGATIENSGGIGNDHTNLLSGEYSLQNIGTINNHEMIKRDFVQGELENKFVKNLGIINNYKTISNTNESIVNQNTIDNHCIGIVTDVNLVSGNNIMNDINDSSCIKSNPYNVEEEIVTKDLHFTTAVEEYTAIQTPQQHTFLKQISCHIQDSDSWVSGNDALMQVWAIDSTGKTIEKTNVECKKGYAISKFVEPMVYLPPKSSINVMTSDGGFYAVDIWIQIKVEQDLERFSTIKESSNPQQLQIPPWIQNTAKWYGDGLVSQSEYINTLQWLIKNNIIQMQ